MTDADPTRCGSPGAEAVTRGEIDGLSEHILALTDAIDRLGARIERIASGALVAVSPNPELESVDRDSDPYAWPSEVEIARYRAGRGPGASP